MKWGHISLGSLLMLAGCSIPLQPSLELPFINQPADLPVSPAAEPGRAYFAAMIDERGRVTDTLFLGAANPSLESTATAALKGTSFMPARAHGRPFPAHTAVTFHFGDSPTQSTCAIEELDAGSISLRFCQADKLDTKPRLLKDVRPEPRSGTGAVKLQYFIDHEGRVRMPMIFSSEDPELSRAVLEAVKGWRFAAPTRNGKPILALVRQEFRFGPP